jgi:hypothetical protein
LDSEPRGRYPRCGKNKSVHEERIRVYKVRIWAMKTVRVGIAPTLGLLHK